jgi:hypothetical protein
MLVDEPAYCHVEAIEHTRVLMANPAVPAIFEAAFEAHCVRIRVDILERLPEGWRLHEVKSSTKVKDEYLEELALQAYILYENKLELVDIHLIHINREYIRNDY